ncbi:uncharacterized protein LOC119441574 isoform X3 [Dermacentor silvarum]|uniref:uncharacterized protein LOC119441574 isoform X3 n=1 Tax=Dermacentor silvarum TaxID=543639 RepID=UPI0021011BC7|nr:uncharacterized protein LOC119441574 isoform X3 [Dermacentor silvarum]
MRSSVQSSCSEKQCKGTRISCTTLLQGALVNQYPALRNRLDSGYTPEQEFAHPTLLYTGDNRISSKALCVKCGYI